MLSPPARRGTWAALAALVACAVAAPAAAQKITAKPDLQPAFRGKVTDYVTRCKAGEPVRFKVDAPDGVSVRVDGARARTGAFTKKVELANGQATSIVVRRDGHGHTHHVRCLPPSFPHWFFRRNSPPQAQWYLLAPQSGADRVQSHYVTFVDGWGVPVWWMCRDRVPFHAKLLPSGELAWARWFGDPFGVRDDGGWEIHRLGGGLVRTLRTVGSPTDSHEMTPLANGHYLLDTYHLRRHVDLSSVGGSVDDNVLDGEIQELDAGGNRVWTWSSKDHIGLAEDTLWRDSKRELSASEMWSFEFHDHTRRPPASSSWISPS